MPYGMPPLARQLEHGRFNRFLATLPPHDFSLLVPHLRTIPLERGAMLHDLGEEIEHVYFPHNGISLVAVMQNGATVETATIGCAGVSGASAGLGPRSTIPRAIVQLAGTTAWISVYGEPDGACDPAVRPARDGEGLHALHGEGRDRRPSR